MPPAGVRSGDAVKTDETLKLERCIWLATVKQGVFGCYEVTIGRNGHERVDFMTCDTKGIYRCYEIKVSVQDFHSSAAKTFCGHYNYFVMPQSLYKLVADEIPKDIGVFCEAASVLPSECLPCICIRKARKRKLAVPADVLKDSLIRSLSRDVGKQVRSGSQTLIESYQRDLAIERARARHYEKQCAAYRRQYENLYQTVSAAFGAAWTDGPGRDFDDTM